MVRICLVSGLREYAYASTQVSRWIRAAASMDHPRFVNQSVAHTFFIKKKPRTLPLPTLNTLCAGPIHMYGLPYLEFIRSSVPFFSLLSFAAPQGSTLLRYIVLYSCSLTDFCAFIVALVFGVCIYEMMGRLWFFGLFISSFFFFLIANNGGPDFDLYGANDSQIWWLRVENYKFMIGATEIAHGKYKIYARFISVSYC